jgi:hypothetical protein
MDFPIQDLRSHDCVDDDLITISDDAVTNPDDVIAIPDDVVTIPDNVINNSPRLRGIRRECISIRLLINGISITIMQIY